ncbi:unnamed protein product [Pleuronectes platessa]|uniref:Uncharacterized protein n=1 Tax=Pleuronectes platessa TaxID=8262 RepID=A0A9N7VVI2_PLEPL|nr:unnamed protein product [Pleuronectes platessa]
MKATRGEEAVMESGSVFLLLLSSNDATTSPDTSSAVQRSWGWSLKVLRSRQYKRQPPGERIRASAPFRCHLAALTGMEEEEEEEEERGAGRKEMGMGMREDGRISDLV